jgi:peptidoglycan/LPS O-acetylase OafA/YrhL
VPQLYLQRYLRLTPVYAVVLALFVFVLPLMDFGPFWDTFDGARQMCTEDWVYNLLYVTNVVTREGGLSCYGVTWCVALSPEAAIGRRPGLTWPSCGVGC